MVNKLGESNLNQHAVATYLSDYRGGATTAVQIVERLIVQTDNTSSYPTNTSRLKRLVGWFAESSIACNIFLVQHFPSESV